MASNNTLSDDQSTLVDGTTTTLQSENNDVSNIPESGTTVLPANTKLEHNFSTPLSNNLNPYWNEPLSNQNLSSPLRFF